MIILSLVPLLRREFSLLCPSLRFYLPFVFFCLCFEVGWIWFFGGVFFVGLELWVYEILRFVLLNRMLGEWRERQR